MYIKSFDAVFIDYPDGHIFNVVVLYGLNGIICLIMRKMLVQMEHKVELPCCVTTGKTWSMVSSNKAYDQSES